MFAVDVCRTLLKLDNRQEMADQTSCCREIIVKYLLRQQNVER